MKQSEIVCFLLRICFDFYFTTIGNIFVDWYRIVFITSVKEKKPGQYEKFILLLDNAPCHLSSDTLNSIDPQFEVFFLPPNVTSILQPMDQGVIECMKRHYKALFLKKIILHDSDSPTAIKTFLKNWNLLNTISTVSIAWSLVPQCALSKSWNKLLGETSLPAVANETTTRKTSLLNQLHSSNIYSENKIEEWI